MTTNELALCRPLNQGKRGSQQRVAAEVDCKQLARPECPTTVLGNVPHGRPDTESLLTDRSRSHNRFCRTATPATRASVSFVSSEARKLLFFRICAHGTSNHYHVKNHCTCAIARTTKDMRDRKRRSLVRLHVRRNVALCSLICARSMVRYTRSARHLRRNQYWVTSGAFPSEFSEEEQDTPA